MLEKLPPFAQAAARQFRDHGKLEGAGVQRSIIPENRREELESQIFGQVEEFLQADESPQDTFKNQPGKVGVDLGDVKFTVQYEGNTEKGQMSLETSGELVSGAYAEFSEDRAILVQTAKQGEQGEGVMATYFDRKDPSKSYIEAFNLVGGMPF